MPHADPHDPDTTSAGARKRYLFQPPASASGRLAEFEAFVDAWLEKNMTPLPADADLSLESWLKRTNYPEKRKEELRRVSAKFRGIFDPEAKHFDCKSFMKDETYVDWKHARCINSRTDAFKCFVGPVTKLIEDELYKHPQYIKHVPVADRPGYILKMLGYTGGVYFATDYTAFESLFIKKFMAACELRLFSYMLKNHDKQIFAAIRRGDAGPQHLTYKKFQVWMLETCRMSGDMWTSLCNGFANDMVRQFCCARLGRTSLGVVEGDDGLFTVSGVYSLEDPIVADLEREVRELGLVIKMEVRSSLSEASFCGLVFDEVDLANVTNPLEVLASFGWGNSKYVSANTDTRRKLLRCKALSLAHQYPGCPILQELSAYVLRCTKPYDLRHFIRERMQTSLWEREQMLSVLGIEVPHREVGFRTRCLVEKLYGIPIENQLAMESYFRSLSSIQPLDIPAIDLMVPRSWIEYHERYVLTVGAQNGRPRLDLWRPYDGFIREW
jgi:hypothetical protein